MRKVSLYEIPPGEELAIDVKVQSSHPDTLYKLRLDEGTVLNQEQITRLRKVGQEYVFIRDSRTEDLNEYIHDKQVARAEENISQEMNKIEKNVEKEEFEAVDTAKLRKTVDNLLNALQDSQMMMAFTSLKSHDDYTAKHSLDVCRLTLAFTLSNREFISRKLQDSSGALATDKYLFEDLGMGALLHDIGKWELPEETLNKSDELEAQDWAAIKKHPQCGYDILSRLQEKQQLRAPVKIPALTHHEKFGGEGYPEELSGKEIHPYGRLTACCDVYSALTSNRPYRVEMTPNRAFQTMNSMQKEDDHFDPDFMDRFLEFLNPFPLGQEVILSDGRRGVVCEITADKTKPVVRVLYRASNHLDNPHEVRANVKDAPDIIN